MTSFWKVAKEWQYNVWLAEQQHSPIQIQNFVATSELMTLQVKDMTELVKVEDLIALKSYGKPNFPAT